ncbi:L,D-transpeptidase family protein [Nocardioides sp. BP30]|uniref:L,D-transpeptidase family protein n=1 Tax=Nocardioides sp. BP30 TaxID=3036374 RepID=UPI00246978B2|nr:L,D-transpeptidase family protein [Nocardioides sp. BP30]WGL53491.1 L,D-transpeptidase family protein [Nocardioides sp. BP30]
MRRLLLALVVAAGPLLLPGLSAPAQAAPSAVTLGGVTVHLRAGTTQVVTVNHRRGSRARVSLWVLRDGAWRRRLTSTDGHIGYGGLVAGGRRHQGTGTTPLGTYGLVSAFGTHPHAATRELPYRRIRPGDYWVEDNASPFYNRYRNKAQGGFRWWLPLSDENGSERLAAYPRQYEYALVLDYNAEQVRHRGAGIFLHVNGTGATAGCVSAPRWLLKKLMHRLDPARVPVIAIGR